MFKIIISYLMSILMFFIPAFSTESEAITFQNKSLSHNCSIDGHVPGTTMFEINCESEGMEYSSCIHCGEFLILNYISPAGHDYYEESHQTGSCTEYSSVTYCCSRCGHCYTETSDSMGHDFEPWYIEDATCGENGYKIRYCRICGEYEDAVIPATGEHTFGEWEMWQYPTCTQEGINIRNCEICGETEEETIPKKIDHAFDVFEYIPPTCVSNGYETIKCSICGFADILEEYEATGHADTNNNGYCDVCEENEFTDSGKFSDNLVWAFDDTTNTLIIWGTGPMGDYYIDPQPWENYRENIEKVVISNGVTSIGEYAFAWCPNLTSLTIGDSVATFGNNIFYASDAITEIMVDSNNPYYSSDEYGVLFNKDKTTIIQYPKGNTRTSYTIPDGVTTIGNYAFYLCTKLTSITIPDSVTTIDAEAFYYCNKLTSITIPDSVTTIGNRAFVFCNSITSITVDSDNQYYSNDEYGVLFNIEKTKIIQYPTGNTRTSYTIPDGVTTIGNYAFYYCNKLTSITIPDSVTTIGDDAFHSCKSLTSVTIGNGVTSIGKGAFSTCTCLTSVTIGDSVTTISKDAFNHCDKLTSITIPDSVTTIGDYAFGNCSSLASVIIGDSVTTIGNYAFADCKLTSIILPDSVTKIGNYAFYDCNLRNVYYEGTSEQWESISISKYNEPLLKAKFHYNYIDPNKFTGIKGDYFYKNDIRLNAYQLVEFEGDFYFINDSHKIAKNKKIYLSERFVEGFTFEDGTPLHVGYYEFDADGKMIILNGPVGDYFYKNNVRQNAYQLVEFEGNFYFINDSHKIAKNKKIYLSEKFIEGFTFEDGTPLQVGYYEFDADGKMIILNGPVGDYFYENNVRLSAYQLVEYEENYYFINDSHKLAKDKTIYLSARFVEGTSLEVGYYTFDADGKLIIQ